MVYLGTPGTPSSSHPDSSTYGILYTCEESIFYVKKNYKPRLVLEPVLNIFGMYFEGVHYGKRVLTGVKK